jgi:hypothetical protein
MLYVSMLSVIIFLISQHLYYGAYRFALQVLTYDRNVIGISQLRIAFRRFPELGLAREGRCKLPYLSYSFAVNFVFRQKFVYSTLLDNL